MTHTSLPAALSPMRSRARLWVGATAAAAVLALTGCAVGPHQGLGMASGAIGGAILGNAIGGTGAATAGGAAIGGLIGNQIGRDLDARAYGGYPQAVYPPHYRPAQPYHGPQRYPQPHPYYGHRY